MYGFVFVSTTAWGDVPDTGKVPAPEFKDSLNFQKGEIILTNGVAKLRVPAAGGWISTINIFFPLSNHCLKLSWDT